MQNPGSSRVFLKKVVCNHGRKNPTAHTSQKKAARLMGTHAAQDLAPPSPTPYRRDSCSAGNSSDQSLDYCNYIKNKPGISRLVFLKCQRFFWAGICTEFTDNPFKITAGVINITRQNFIFCHTGNKNLPLAG